MKKEFLDGIQLDDTKPFYDWAMELLPWLNGTMRDVAAGIGTNLAEMKERQIRYTAYAGRLVEILAEAEAYYQTALADEMTRLREQGMSPMLIGRIAEGRVKNEAKVFNAVKRLNQTLENLLISMASRLKFEKATMYGEGENPPPF
ncbi:MAG TPA: hypothetical protein GXZ26_10275 [Firmicutes bacterium]|nr:hypothetical protein [Bacillota bacterium]